MQFPNEWTNFTKNDKGGTNSRKGTIGTCFKTPAMCCTRPCTSEALVMSAFLVETLNPRDDRLQSLEPFVEFCIQPLLASRFASIRICGQFLVKCSSVGACLHCNLFVKWISEDRKMYWRRTHGENALDHEIMELLQGSLVRSTECRSKLLTGVCLRVLKGLAGEQEPTKQPH